MIWWLAYVLLLVVLFVRVDPGAAAPRPGLAALEAIIAAAPRVARCLPSMT